MVNDENQNPFPFYGFEYDAPPASEAVWETMSTDWEDFIRRAHDYGWPEDYIFGAYLRDHRVSYRERLTSMAKIRQYSEEGKLSEALLENDRTMMREPGARPGSLTALGPIHEGT